MSLNAGEKLGPHEIVELVSSGGMGAVYKARDGRLNRVVAIKQLAAKHMTRFEQEARAVAALNLANICQIHYPWTAPLRASSHWPRLARLLNLPDAEGW